MSSAFPKADTNAKVELAWTPTAARPTRASSTGTRQITSASELLRRERGRIKNLDLDVNCELREAVCSIGVWHTQNSQDPNPASRCEGPLRRKNPPKKRLDTLHEWDLPRLAIQLLLPHLSLTQGVALKPKAAIRVSRRTA
jgi:hypothetical protein